MTDFGDGFDFERVGLVETSVAVRNALGGDKDARTIRVILSAVPEPSAGLSAWAAVLMVAAIARRRAA